MKTYSAERIAIDALSHSDLVAIAAEIAGNPFTDVGVLKAYRLIVTDGYGRELAERTEALIVDGRIGLAAGGDADWGDAGHTWQEQEDAIHDWLNDAEAWEARN